MSEVAIFTDYKLDESYTPVKISIRVGNTFSDLREVGAAVMGAAACSVCAGSSREATVQKGHCQAGAYGCHCGGCCLITA